MTINEILANPELATSITDAEIKNLAYGITYYSPWGDDPDTAWDTLRVLRNRLAQIESQERQPQSRTAKMVRCDCGHTVEADLVMSASLGTSCPDCYDRMSD